MISEDRESRSMSSSLEPVPTKVDNKPDRKYRCQVNHDNPFVSLY